MTNALTLPQNFGPMSTKFAALPADDNLASGITGGFGVISYRGKTWAIKAGGTETPLMRADGDGPVNSIEVVILKASPYISKVYYADGYVQGSDKAPDCFSNDGIRPDASVVVKQNDSCLTCPMNAWGSRKNDTTGKDGKACSDSKRLAVLPLGDLDDKGNNGPMLLRVPPASLQDTKRYGTTLAGYGYQYYTVGSRIAFDPVESFPKFVYSAIRPLTDDEAEKVIRWRDDAQTESILSAADPTQVASAGGEAKMPFEQPPPAAKPAVAAGEDKSVAARVQMLQAQMAAKKASEEAASRAGPAAASPATPATDKAAQIAALQAQLKAKKDAEAAASAAAEEAKKKAAAEAAAAKRKAAAEAAAAKKKADEEALAAAAAAQTAAHDPGQKSDEEMEAELAALMAEMNGTAPDMTNSAVPLVPVLEGEVLDALPNETDLAPAEIEAALNKMLGR